jgi:phospholipase A-2-activating protein
MRFEKLIFNNIILVNQSIQAKGADCLTRLDDKRFISSSFDFKLNIWELVGNGLVCTKSLIGHTNNITKIIVLPGLDICSCSHDKTIKVWNNYKCIQSVIAHDDVINCIDVLSTKFIVSGSNDNTVKLWDFSNKVLTCVHTIKIDAKVKTVSTFSDNSICVVDDYRVQLWSMTSE